MYTVSERYIHALLQLPQFLPFQPSDTEDLRAVHVLTGAQVFPIPDPDELNHELITVKFSAGHMIQVIGGLYFQLQVAEAAEHYQHAPTEEGSGPVSKEARQIYEHLTRKHDLG
jgi:hypothetical protein